MMRRMRWAMCLWPGLPQLYLRGSWSALAVAVGAAVLLDLALLCSFGWSELVAPDLRVAIWLSLAVAWVASLVVSVVWSRRQGCLKRPDPAADTFGEAVEHYLKGDWFQAQRVLDGLLQKDARDLDARLMLATLLRHTGRPDEASGQLDLLGRTEGAGKWESEIRRERELLAETETRQSTSESCNV